MQHDPLLARIIPALADVPGVAAIALGGSRARGTARDASDHDIGLYFSAGQPLDTDRLVVVAKTMVDDPNAAAVTPVGGWGPWIIGSARSALSTKSPTAFSLTGATAFGPRAPR